MPELPEVETTRLGIKDPILGKKITELVIRQYQLRWPIPSELRSLLKGQVLKDLTRRAKYILFHFKVGTLILHLGMSGRLSVFKDSALPKKHDHLDMLFSNGYILRFTDPRRFGAILFTKEPPHKHPLLSSIGPEPLTDDFNGAYLFEAAKGRKVAVKIFIMNSKIVAGVGNIYAAEALFMAKIHPETRASDVTHKQYQKLATAIKKILLKAIEKGGTTLKDFMKPSGRPGYFSLALKVYGKAGKPCERCGTQLKSLRIGQRATVYCPTCQA